MSAERFIDTNVFIYQLERLDPAKADVADALIEEGIARGNACVSFQVVQECINTALRKAEVPLTEMQMRQYLDDVLVPLWTVYPTPEIYRRSLDVRSRYQFSFFDSLILASAMEAGCTTLLTEDLQDGQRIESLVIRNPFIAQ